MWEKKLTINGTEYIREDWAIEYVRELEEKHKERLVFKDVPEIYQLTQGEFDALMEAVDLDSNTKQMLKITAKTPLGKLTGAISYFTTEQIINLNKIINFYWNRMFYAVEEAMEEDQ